MNRTLVIIKPDAVERGIVGEILTRLERENLHIVAGSWLVIEPDLAERHYAEHKGQPYYDLLVKFVSRSPSFVFVVEGPEDTWKLLRKMIGPTNPADAPPGTIRGDFGTSTQENVMHGSDSAESAAREIALFFPNLK